MASSSATFLSSDLSSIRVSSSTCRKTRKNLGPGTSHSIAFPRHHATEMASLSATFLSSDLSSIRVSSSTCSKTRKNLGPGISHSIAFPHHHATGSCQFTVNKKTGLSRRRWSKSTVECSGASSTQAGKAPDLSVDPLFDKFITASQKGNLVPMFKRIFSDHLTPVLAYRCLVKEEDRIAPSFLFESVENGQSVHVGRFSIVGARPSIEIIAKHDQITILNHKSGTRVEKTSEDPMSEPGKIAANWQPAPVEGLPENVFCGGWVGYFSYDTVRYTEKKKLPFSGGPNDDRDLPDIHLSLYNEVVIFDHVSKILYAVHWVHMGEFSSPELAYLSGESHLRILVSQLHALQDEATLSLGAVDMSLTTYGKEALESNFTADQYKESILKVKEHIAAGDIFQLVLSQRFERRTFASPFEIYRALRVVNPSPYMAYMQARGCTLVASSPEILTRTVKGKVVNRPLAGTRRRGQNLKEDKALEVDLLTDEKECAEHVMLVDLGRNDVGKVSKAGTVRVETLMEVERYSHVMHISSTVTGELLEELSCWDALRAALPVGTVSGAPKVRAMQLIDTLEPTRRGPYSGGLGTISFTGDLDVALALRTMVIPTARKDSLYSYQNGETRQEFVVHLQAGAGIVADSDPASEHQECINKAAGLARAIDLAEAAFHRD